MAFDHEILQRMSRNGPGVDGESDETQETKMHTGIPTTDRSGEK